MNDYTCLMCGAIDSYTTISDKDIICPRCTTRLVMATQEQLKSAYKKAEENKMTNKMRALESFLIKEEENVKQVNPRRFVEGGGKNNIQGSRKPVNRGRGNKSIRGKQTAVRPIKKQERLPFCKNNLSA